MRIECLSKKDFKERFGPNSLGEHWTEAGEHIIYLPRGSSTKTRMHEIAHVELGHESPKEKPLTFSESAKRELEADDWVYKKLGKDLSLSEVLTDFWGLVDELFDKGYSVIQVFNWVIKEIEDFGYDISREERSYIWWVIREKRAKRGSN